MIPIRIPSSVPLLSMLLLSCCCMVGCQFAPKKLTDSWKWGEGDKPALPDRILAVWTDTVLHQPNQPGVRGFGGRVFFYLKDQTDPIEVDGKLAVYVFDSEDADPMNQKPVPYTSLKPPTIQRGDHPVGPFFLQKAYTKYDKYCSLVKQN